MNQTKLTDLIVENILFTGVSVKMKITDSISENLTNSDSESIESVFYRKYSLLFSGSILCMDSYYILIINEKVLV